MRNTKAARSATPTAPCADPVGPGVDPFDRLIHRRDPIGRPRVVNSGAQPRHTGHIIIVCVLPETARDSLR